MWPPNGGHEARKRCYQIVDIPSGSRFKWPTFDKHPLTFPLLPNSIPIGNQVYRWSPCQHMNKHQTTYTQVTKSGWALSSHSSFPTEWLQSPDMRTNSAPLKECVLHWYYEKHISEATANALPRVNVVRLRRSLILTTILKFQSSSVFETPCLWLLFIAVIKAMPKCNLRRKEFI